MKFPRGVDIDTPKHRKHFRTLVQFLSVLCVINYGFNKITLPMEILKYNLSYNTQSTSDQNQMKFDFDGFYMIMRSTLKIASPLC